MKVASLSTLRTGRLYLLGYIPCTHFCQRLSRSENHSAAGRIFSTKNTNDPNGNRTRDPPACRCTQYSVFVHGRLSQSLNRGLFDSVRSRRKRVISTDVWIGKITFHAWTAVCKTIVTIYLFIYVLSIDTATVITVFLFHTGVLTSPYVDLLPDVFCLMVRIFLLMLVLLYI